MCHVYVIQSFDMETPNYHTDQLNVYQWLQRKPIISHFPNPPKAIKQGRTFYVPESPKPSALPMMTAHGFWYKSRISLLYRSENLQHASSLLHSAFRFTEQYHIPFRSHQQLRDVFICSSPILQFTRDSILSTIPTNLLKN